MKITQEEMTLLEQVVSEFAIPEYDPKIHVTLAELADKWGISKNGARNRMDKMTDKYERILVKGLGNQAQTAYKRIDPGQ